jgi:hypothetical protein
LSCGDCRYFVGAGLTEGQTEPICMLVDISPMPEDYCDEFTPALSDGRQPSVSAQTLAVMSQPAHLDLYITRVAPDKDGRKRWYATSSGVKRDAYGEWMTIDLFRDFIQRIKKNEPAPELFASPSWKGGHPYLGVAHYLDMDGFGIVGDTEKEYIDGSTFKARGYFRDTPLAEAAYGTIKRDIEAGIPPEQRTRISIAFVDWGHDHGPHGAFQRRSLVDHCDLCERGVGEKHYRAGQLVHLALTRMPAYNDTEIALEERSMTSKRGDAASIVGDEMAEELERRARKLTERAIDPGAIVMKAEDAAATPPSAPAEGEAMMQPMMGEEKPVVTGTMETRGYLGGAKTLADAHAFLSRSRGVLLDTDSWAVLGAVLTNIAGHEHGESIRSTLSEFQKTVDIMAVRALTEVAPLLKPGGAQVTDVVERTEPPVETAPAPAAEPAPEPTPVAPAPAPEPESEVVAPTPEPTAHVLDAPLTAFKAAYDTVMAASLNPADRGSALQPHYDALADVVMRAMAEEEEAPALAADGTILDPQQIGAIISRQVSDQVAAQFAPIAAAQAAMQQELRAVLNAMAVRSAGPRDATPRVSPRKPLEPVGLQRRAVQLVPRTMGLQGSGGLITLGAPNQKPVSPLRALVRRSVGIQQE